MLDAVEQDYYFKVKLMFNEYVSNWGVAEIARRYMIRRDSGAI